MPSGHSVRSNSMANRAQLTPLKNDSYEKARGNMNFAEDKKRKIDRLDPIQISTDNSKKYL